MEILYWPTPGDGKFRIALAALHLLRFFRILRLQNEQLEPVRSLCLLP